MEDAGATALHLAAAKGFTNVARLLVMVGANCEHTDQQGRFNYIAKLLKRKIFHFIILTDLNVIK